MFHCERIPNLCKLNVAIAIIPLFLVILIEELPQTTCVTYTDLGMKKQQHQHTYLIVVSFSIPMSFISNKIKYSCYKNVDLSIIIKRNETI